MDNSLTLFLQEQLKNEIVVLKEILFLSVLFICISIITVKIEVWELQEQQEQLKNEIVELKVMMNNEN